MASLFPDGSGSADRRRTRFALIGWGWRAEFYARIARELPEELELTSVLLRDPAKAERLAAETGLPTTTSLAELTDTNPDFVVLSVARGATFGMLVELFEAGVPVLAETPPGESVEELVELWHAAQLTNAQVQVAEQYPYQPLYSAWESFVGSGGIGEPLNVSLSALHGYHAMAIIRRMLGVGYQDARIDGERFTFRVTETLDRSGPILNGPVVPSERVRATLRFDPGRVAFFDFADPAQYHSYIRTRQLNVQGTRGEIDDLEARYLNGDGMPVHVRLERIDSGMYKNQGWSHQRLLLGERVLYTSPVPQARLNDDEIAVATCLLRMADQVAGVAGAAAGYTLAEALQDTYLALLVQEAVANPRTLVTSRQMPWAEQLS